MKVEEYKRTELVFTEEELRAISTTKEIVNDLTLIVDTFGLIRLDEIDFDSSNFEETFSLLECFFYELLHNNNKILIEDEANH